VLCAGADADADDEADELRDTELELEEDEWEVLDDSLVEDIVAFLDPVPERVGSIDPDDVTEVTSEPEADDMRDVGVTTEVGAAVLSVGSTRPLGPKKGALLGSNTGPVSTAYSLALQTLQCAKNVDLHCATATPSIPSTKNTARTISAQPSISQYARYRTGS